MAANPDQQPWSFDVSSLMVLIGESDQLNYRLSQRSLLAPCLVMVPVVGLQNYVRSYDLLLDPSSLNYYSPYDVKGAPLRNIQLATALKGAKLLEDKMYSVYRINPDGNQKELRKLYVLQVSWVAGTWLLFGGLLAFCLLVPDTTWISLASCVGFTGWSILLRLMEYFNVMPSQVAPGSVTDADKEDAAFIMGRDNSAFVLMGMRGAVKDWTSRGLEYRKDFLHVPTWLWQSFTHIGSLLMLLFIFSSVPNGSTMDQVAFIILNGLAQLNVYFGQWLNSRYCLAQLSVEETGHVPTRTHVYAKLLRRFYLLDKTDDWIEASGILPKTKVWNTWKTEVVAKPDRDAKSLYEEIAHRPEAPPVDPGASGGTP
jgi:hypothetical protein